MAPGLRKILLFAASFIPVLVLLLWLYPHGLPWYERLVVAVANPCLRMLSPPLEIEVGVRGELDAYALSSREQRKPIFGQSYSPHVIYLSLVLLPSLLLATPGKIANRLRLLAIGLVLLFVLHVLTMIVLLHSYLCLQRNPSSFACFWIHGIALTSGQVGAVAGWALLTWSTWFPKTGESVPSRIHPKPRRNAACPCGSGLKYKRCCGR